MKNAIQLVQLFLFCFLLVMQVIIPCENKQHQKCRWQQMAENDTKFFAACLGYAGVYGSTYVLHMYKEKLPPSLAKSLVITRAGLFFFSAIQQLWHFKGLYNLNKLG
jgi:hypothetical protein